MALDLQHVKERLIATNEEFSRLSREHSYYERQLEELYNRPHLTDADRIEEINLKKRKLSLKDQMERIIQQYKKAGDLTH
ncbi:MAG: YdcH family protein [Acidobacteria bacterium]|nr:YdcH family protein [Acidobacteriota bacterium]